VIRHRFALGSGEGVSSPDCSNVGVGSRPAGGACAGCAWIVDMRWCIGVELYIPPERSSELPKSKSAGLIFVRSL
jgi:hypothetical protein